MTARRVALTVCVAVAIAALFVLLVILLSSPGSTSPNPGSPNSSSQCPGQTASSGSPCHPTPADPVLLAQSAQYATSSGSIVFTINLPADLTGSWTASAPLALVVVNSTNPMLYGWPCPSCYALNGSLNQTLFPGTYVIEFAGLMEHPDPILTATQTIQLKFDRNLVVLQTPFATNLSAGNFSSWSIPVISDSTYVWLTGVLETTACSYSIAILPAASYAAFQTNRSVIYSSSYAEILDAAGSSSCPTPGPLSYAGIGISSLNLTSNQTLVFYNSSQATVQFVVTGSIELSYIPAD